MESGSTHSFRVSPVRIRTGLRRVLIALAVVAVLVGAAWLLSSLGARHGMIVVHYRRTAYPVPRVHPDYSDAQAAEIAGVILHDRAPATAENYQRLIDYLNTLEAPGYGSSTGGFGEVTGLGKFTYISVQLPKKSSHRVMIYRADRDGSAYAYFDDFMMDGVYPPSFRFVSEGDDVVYLDDRSHREIKRVRVPGRQFAGLTSPIASASR